MAFTRSGIKRIFKVKARAKTFSVESGPCRSSVASSGITGTGDQAELHFSEAWFHGNLERGRETAEQMLYENAHMGDGTFIVRKSQVRGVQLDHGHRGRPQSVMLSMSAL